MFAPCLSLILMALVLKANGEPYSGYNLTGWPFLELQWTAFILHSIVHILLLYYFIPCFELADEPDDDDNRSFSDIAKFQPCTWFTTNPVHCLRSRYLLNHQPPCTYWFLGKNYLLQADDKRNTHFTCEREHLPEGSYGNALMKGLSTVSSKVSQRFSKKAEQPKEENKEEKAEDAKKIED